MSFGEIGRKGTFKCKYIPRGFNIRVIINANIEKN